MLWCIPVIFQHSSLRCCIPLVKYQSSFNEFRSLAIRINIKTLNSVNRKRHSENISGIYGILHCCLLKMIQPNDFLANYQLLITYNVDKVAFILFNFSNGFFFEFEAWTIILLSYVLFFCYMKVRLGQLHRKLV